MPRLHMFVEGTTEQVFADTVLKPHLANCGVYLHEPMLVAHARKKGHVHRGGGMRFRTMHNDLSVGSRRTHRRTCTLRRW